MTHPRSLWVALQKECVLNKCYWFHVEHDFSPALLALCEENHKGQWGRALVFSLICAWTKSWANDRDVGIWDSIALIMASLWCFQTGLGTVVTAFSLIGKSASTGVFNLLYVYTSEIFPTEVRSVGLGYSNFWARVSGMLAPYAGNSLVSIQ